MTEHTDQGIVGSGKVEIIGDLMGLVLDALLHGFPIQETRIVWHLGSLLQSLHHLIISNNHYEEETVEDVGRDADDAKVFENVDQNVGQVGRHEHGEDAHA